MSDFSVYNAIKTTGSAGSVCDPTSLMYDPTQCGAVSGASSSGATPSSGVYVDPNAPGYVQVLQGLSSLGNILGPYINSPGNQIKQTLADAQKAAAQAQLVNAKTIAVNPSLASPNWLAIAGIAGVVGLVVYLIARR